MITKNITDLFDNKLTIEFNRLAMKERCPHRRGAENAEAPQREEEKEEERREGAKKLSLFLSSSSLRGLSVLCASAVREAFQSSTNFQTTPKRNTYDKTQEDPTGIT